METDEQVRALAEAAGIDGGELTITPLSGGTVNRTFRLDETGAGPMVLRLAPSDTETAAGPSWLTPHGLRREQEAIRLLADLRDFLPRTVHFDDTRTLVDRDWVIQTVVPGRPWAAVRAALDDAAERELWRELGALTARMHLLEGPEFGPPDVGFGTATWAELLRWDATGFVVDAERYGMDKAPMEALCALIDASVPLLEQITQPRLIHSDLTLAHVFVAPDAAGHFRVTGLIDLEFGRFADRFSETIFLEHALTPESEDVFAAFCGGYDCPPFSHEDERRHRIYRLVGLGWTVTDLLRRGLGERVPTVLERMAALQAEAEKA